MKKVKKIIIISLILTSCQSAKDAFTLKKKVSADEFLVEKKSPLALPPEYGQLPLPENVGINNNQLEKEKEIKTLIVNESKNSSEKNKKNSKPSSIEESILEKIR